jgi:hypothetical protein
MAGVTDVPFRELAWNLGAGLVVAEMTSANPQLWETRTSRLRRETVVGARPRVVQIAGADPEWIAVAAKREADDGAEIRREHGLPGEKSTIRPQDRRCCATKRWLREYCERPSRPCPFQ